MGNRLERLGRRLSSLDPGKYEGMITAVIGSTIYATGINASVGEICEVSGVSSSLLAEVVGFREGRSVLMPLEDVQGLGPGAVVKPLGTTLTVRTGEDMLGRVIDALGRPLDGKPLPEGPLVKMINPAPSPLERKPIDKVLPTGVASIDAFLTIGRGQRMGIFAGSGVGKSTLLGMISRDALSDVNVIALIGERGREVRAFLEEVLGEEGLERSIVVVATSDSPPLLRFKAPYTAIAISEYFRDRSRDVLLVMDSITRFAFAAREIGLAAGEPPTMRGYPPSLFADLPRMMERLGTSGDGSITGIITVLVEGDDMNEPVADTMRSILDGHIVLSREIAATGRYPSVDILRSVSRLMNKIAGRDHLEAAGLLRQAFALYEENKDLIQIGAYKKGSDPRLDRAIDIALALEDFMKQGIDERREFEDTLERIKQIASMNSSKDGA